METQIDEARAILHPSTAEQRVALWESALRELEERRDELVAACDTLRRLVESERKIAARERGACTNCGHLEPHDGPAGDVADACTFPGCNCGFDSRGDTSRRKDLEAL